MNCYQSISGSRLVVEVVRNHWLRSGMVRDKVKPGRCLCGFDAVLLAITFSGTHLRCPISDLTARSVIYECRNSNYPASLRS